MNENIPSSSVPPPIPAAFPSATPLGDDPADRLPIAGVVSAVEAMLRQPRRMFFQLRGAGSSRIIGGLFFVATFCALIYGLVVGTFSGGAQLWAAPVKVAGGLLVSGLICLPSLYIFSCLSGSQARLVEVGGLVTALLGLTTVLLIGFAPVAWVFSQSTSSPAAMGALHLVFWFVATFFGWRLLRNGLAHLNARSSGTLSVWMCIFVLVCLQMTTALRPLIGTSDSFFPREKKFFLAHWMDTLGQKEAKTQAAGQR